MKNDASSSTWNAVVVVVTCVIATFISFSFYMKVSPTSLLCDNYNSRASFMLMFFMGRVMLAVWQA